MPATYEPIASTTLGTAAASHTFSSIPGTFTDLVVIVVGSGSTSTDVYLRFNGDTASNYSNTYLGNIGNSAASGRDPIPALGLISTGITLNHFHVMSYANTNVFKTSLGTAADGQDSRSFKRVTLWRSTAAVTSVEVSKPSGNFNAGTTFSLYGIKAA